MPTLKTIILRPSADNGVSHSKSSGNNGYSLVNEVAPDNETTYVYQEHRDTSDTPVVTTSKFEYDNSGLPSRFQIQSANITTVYTAWCNVSASNSGTVTFDSKITASVTFNGEEWQGPTQQTIVNRTASRGERLNIPRNWVTKTESLVNFPTEIQTNDNINIVCGFTTSSLAKGSTTKNPTQLPKTEITNQSLQINYYDVYNCVANTGEGIVAATVDKTTVVDGTEVTFSCTLKNHSVFIGWVDENGNVVSTSTIYKTSIEKDTVLTAVAEMDAYIYLRMDNAWVKTEQYKKINGSWVMIDDPKDIFDAKKRIYRKNR